MMKSILVKLQAHSVQAATLLQTDFIADSFGICFEN